MKTFYIHFGSDGINRVLPEGTQPLVNGEKAVWTREMREQFGGHQDVEFIDGEVRKKVVVTTSKVAHSFNWKTVAGVAAAAGAGLAIGGYFF